MKGGKWKRRFTRERRWQEREEDSHSWGAITANRLEARNLPFLINITYTISELCLLSRSGPGTGIPLALRRELHIWVSSLKRYNHGWREPYRPTSVSPSKSKQTLICFDTSQIRATTNTHTHFKVWCAGSLSSDLFILEVRRRVDCFKWRVLSFC